MGSSSPLPGLFPERNNIQVLGSQTDSHDESITPDDNDRISNSSDSIDTEILRRVLSNEDIHGLTAYHDKVQNQRFYLVDKYSEEKRKDKEDTVSTSPIQSRSELDSSDFAKYDREVTRGYMLRNKLQSLLQQQNGGDVQVLNEDSLHKNFSAGRDLDEQVKDRKFTRFKKFTNSFIPQSIKKHNIESSSTTLSRSTSTKTYVIDDTSVRNVAIDEDALPVSQETTLKHQSPKYQGGKGRWRLIVDLENLFSGASGSHHIQRKLKVRHLQMIGTGACFGVGIFLNSGKAFSIAGPFGALLGFSLSGSIILATLISFTELSTLIPVSSGFSGLASRFVEDAFGFALGWTYWFSCLITMPTQIIASIFYLRYYDYLRLGRGGMAGFITLFMLYAVVINLLDVRIMGEIVYFTGLIKIIISIIMILAMVILNSGAGTEYARVGFRYWDSSKSFSTHTFGMFRPTFDLYDTGGGSTHGIKGSGGRFLALASAMLISTFAYTGIEMAFVASGEAINPRKTIPSATKRTFCVVLVIYVFIIFSVSINMYSGDPRLEPYFAGSYSARNKAAQKRIGTEWQLSRKCHDSLYRDKKDCIDITSSPWVLALQNFGFCTFSAVFNGILIFFTSGAEICSLFSSSRTLYAMAVQRKAPAIFQRCNKQGVPYASVIFCSMFGVVAYLAVDRSALENFDVLANMSSASTCIIWMGLNVSFLRFYYALKTRRDIISRDEKSYPYRSPFQPYLAFYGLFGCSLFIIFMGFTNFIHHFWSVRSFFAAYGGLILFIVCYLGYKMIGTSKIQRLDQLDMDTGRREMDRVIWNESRQYSGTYRERLKYLISWLF